MIITGDMTQIDLPHTQKSGLIEALHILNGVEGIGVVNLNQKDIVRHKLVTRIVKAYERFDSLPLKPGGRGSEEETVENNNKV